MIKIGMCDDDLNTLDSVSKMIEAELWEQDIDAEITCISSSQKEIFDLIYKRELDVLFLDVDFKDKGKLGIDFAKDLRINNKEFTLVFLTAHQRYMHVSFPVKVFDYLVKPVNKAVLSDLVSRIKSDYEQNKRKFVHFNKWLTVRVNDIFFIEKEGNKCKIVTEHKSEYVSKTLEQLLNDLPAQFIKCHKSYILNDNRVTIIDKKNNYAYFPNGLFCPISSNFNL